MREYGILLPYTKIGTAIVVDYEEKLRQGLLQYEEERRNYLKYRFEDQADSLTLDKINTLESVYRAKIWSAMRKAAAAIAEEQEQELRGALDSAAASWWAKMLQDHEDAVNALVFVDFFSMEVTKRRIIVNSQIVIRCDLMEEAEAEYLTALVVDEKSTRFDMAVQLEERIRDAIQREEDRWIVRFFTDHEDLAYIKRTNEIMYEERRARCAIRDEQGAGLAELIDQSVTETRKIEEEYEARVRAELTQSIHASKYRILFEQLAKDERRARKSLDKQRIREEVDVIHHFFERERGLLVEEQHNAFTDLLITEMEPSRRSALVEYEESLRQRMMQLFFNMTLRLRIRDLLKEEQEVRYEDLLEPMYFAHCVKNFVVDESALITNAIQDHEAKCRTALEEECRSKYFEWQREQLLRAESDQRRAIKSRAFEVATHIALKYSAASKMALVMDEMAEVREAFVTFALQRVLPVEVIEPEAKELKEIQKRFINEGFPLLLTAVAMNEEKHREFLQRGCWDEYMVALEARADDVREIIETQEKRSRGLNFSQLQIESSKQFVLYCIETEERKARSVIASEQRLRRVMEHIAPQEDYMRNHLQDERQDEICFLVDLWEFESRKLLQEIESEEREYRINNALATSASMRRRQLLENEKRARQQLFDQHIQETWTLNVYVQQRWGVPTGQRRSVTFINTGTLFQFALENRRSAIAAEERRLLQEAFRAFQQQKMCILKATLHDAEIEERQEIVKAWRSKFLDVIRERCDEHLQLFVWDAEFDQRCRIFMAKEAFFRNGYYAFNEARIREGLFADFHRRHLAQDFDELRRKERSERRSQWDRVFGDFYNRNVLQQHNEPFERKVISDLWANQFAIIQQKWKDVSGKWERWLLQRREVTARIQTITRPAFHIWITAFVRCEVPVHRHLLLCTEYVAPLLNKIVPQFEVKLRNAIVKDEAWYAKMMFREINGFLVEQKDRFIRRYLEPKGRASLEVEEIGARLSMMDARIEPQQRRAFVEVEETKDLLSLWTPFTAALYSLRFQQLIAEEKTSRRDTILEHIQRKSEIYQLCGAAERAMLMAEERAEMLRRTMFIEARLRRAMERERDGIFDQYCKRHSEEIAVLDIPTA